MNQDQYEYMYEFRWLLILDQQKKLNFSSPSWGGGTSTRNVTYSPQMVSFSRKQNFLLREFILAGHPKDGCRKE